MEPAAVSVHYNIGTPAHEGAPAAKQDSSRLHIAGSRAGEVLLAKDINVIENKAKATLYNAVGHLWTSVKNKFSSEHAQVMPRRKYVPLTVEDGKGGEKIVFVNVNSLMKNLLDTKGADREAKLKETDEGKDKTHINIIKGLSTDTLKEQGDEIRKLIDGMVKKNIGATERRTEVDGLVNRPIPKDTAKSVELDPFKPLVWYPSVHSTGEKYEKLCKARMGLSGTATGQTGESDKSRPNWEKADKVVAGWAESREPLTLDKVLEINKMLCEGLANNGGEAGALRRPGQDIRAGSHTYIAGSHVEGEMQNFMAWLEKGIAECDKGKGSPVTLAAQAYQRLVSIHPFRDGNGRTTRMVMDYVLQRYGLPPAALKESNVAVFGGKGVNIGAHRAVEIVKTGIEESCKHMGLEPPFKTPAEAPAEAQVT